MTLRFDPTNIDHFKTQIRGIPGYPAGAELPIREVIAVSSLVRFAALTPAPTDAEVQFAFLSAALLRYRFAWGDLFVFLNWAQVHKNL